MTGTLSTPGTSQIPWEPDTSLLDAAREIAPIIRAHSEEAERERRLSQPVLKALRETGLLRMTTPRSLGGLETDPVTRALVGEEIGRHDSAAAWTLENPLDWAFVCCRLPDEGAEEIYSGGADILIAAQLGRPLKATSANGGYRVSGRAPFVVVPDFRELQNTTLAQGGSPCEVMQLVMQLLRPCSLPAFTRRRSRKKPRSTGR